MPSGFMDMPQRLHLGPSGYSVEQTGHFLLFQLYANSGVTVTQVAVFVNFPNLFNYLVILLATVTQ